MKGYDFWKEGRRTSETYLRTNRKDWNNALKIISKEIGNASKILDIGSGDGHTTRQVISRISTDAKIDLLEPDSKAINISKRMLKDFKIRNFYQIPLAKFSSENKYDVNFSIHSNYYWGEREGEQDIRQYKYCLDKLVEMAPKTLIMTQPEISDYYAVCDKGIFPDWVYSKFILEHYKSKGLSVRQEECGMKFYVGDLNEDSYAAKETWRFFNNTEREPNSKEISTFLKRINSAEKKGKLNFKDVLLVVER